MGPTSAGCIIGPAGGRTRCHGRGISQKCSQKPHLATGGAKAYRTLPPRVNRHAIGAPGDRKQCPPVPGWWPGDGRVQAFEL